MAQELKPGSRWVSAVCDTEVIVVKAASNPVTLECGGREMLAQGTAKPEDAAVDPSYSEGSPLGKRFSHGDSGLEVLVAKAGAGSLAVDGEAIAIKDSKPLPSSD